MTEETTDILEAEASETALAKPSGHLVLSGTTMLPSVEDMKPILAEYDKRKKFFLSWLKEHFIEGVHYGTPPGCAPRSGDSKQWRHKPSLYDAGARLFVDLFGCRLTYESAPDLVEQMSDQAKNAGAFARRCTVHASTGEVIGEGTGCFVVGEKKMGENPAIKMCDKRARVAAVLDAFAFARELFTQDLEELASPVQQLTQWVAVIRKEAGVEARANAETLNTASWLAKVAEQVLYGQSVITTRKECDVVSAAIRAGQFDLTTGDRLADPKPLEAPGSPPEPDSAPEAPQGGKPSLKATKGHWWALAQAAAAENPRDWPDLKKNAANWFLKFAESVIARSLPGTSSLTDEDLAQLDADMAEHSDPRAKDER